MSKQTTLKYAQWEEDVTLRVAAILGSTYSDAAGVVESQPLLLQTCWDLALDAEQTSAKILVAASS